MWSPSLPRLSRRRMAKKKKRTKMISNAASSRSKRRKDVIPYLHDDIVRKILIKLPATCLHGVMRNVCRTWRETIDSPDFINEQLQRSKPGFFLQKSSKPYCARFLEILPNGESEVVPIDFRFPGRIFCCNQGVALFGRPFHGSLYAVNPVTMEVARFPYPGQENSCRPSRYAYAITRASDPMGEIKVIYAQQWMDECKLFGLTLGIDLSWKELDITLSVSLTGYIRALISIGQSLYLIGEAFMKKDGSSYFVIVEMDTKTVHELQFPWGDALAVDYFTIEDHLACCVYCGGDYHEVYFLEDLSGNWALYHMGHWTLYHKIEDSLLHEYDYSANVIAWINHELIFLSEKQKGGSMSLFAYNRKTGTFRWIEGSSCELEETVNCQTMSLVTWNKG